MIKSQALKKNNFWNRRFRVEVKNTPFWDHYGIRVDNEFRSFLPYPEVLLISHNFPNTDDPQWDYRHSHREDDQCCGDYCCGCDNERA